LDIIDLRSDTVTQPTPQMRLAMAEARVGDDVFGEDPTVLRLESLAAQTLGKEKALFVASGTMANLVAGLTHCQRGDEIILGSESHFFHNEVGGIAALGGVHVRTVQNDTRGMMSPDELELAVRTPGINRPRTAMISIENTHNRCGGSVLNSEDTLAIAEIAHSHEAALHVDGARIFNAAVALDVPVKLLANVADTVSFCLSKGLSCPVGSLICGPQETIEVARKNRKMLGGGMRQVGILAAAGIFALENMVARLNEDHSHARRLAEGIAQMRGLSLDSDRVQTNIVIFEVIDVDVPWFLNNLEERGVLASYMGGRKVRMVTHYGIGLHEIDETLSLLEEITKEFKFATD
jgi:threonine aldolase